MAHSKKTLAAALGAAFLATSVAPMASAEVNPFSAQQLSGGYDLANYGKHGEGIERKGLTMKTEEKRIKYKEQSDTGRKEKSGKDRKEMERKLQIIRRKNIKEKDICSIVSDKGRILRIRIRRFRSGGVEKIH